LYYILEGNSQNDITLLILTGSLGMILLALIIIFIVVVYKKRVLLQQNEIQKMQTDYQKQLLSATIRVQEREREEIAKNIHDDLGAVLSVLRLNTIKGLKNVDNHEVIENTSKQNQQLLNDASEILKSISRQLAPPALMKLGYIRGIEELCKIIRNTGEIKIDFNYDNDESRFPHEIDVQLYRITNELINNTIRHSKANIIQLHLRKENNLLHFQLQHNGVGIGANEIERLLRSDEGLGIKSIHSRVQMINGEIKYSYEKNKDALISITVPL